MYFKLDGAERKRGTYNGNDYDNLQLYLSEDESNNDNGFGSRYFPPNKSKIKYSLISDVFGVSVDVDYLRSYKDKYIDVYFNQYGNISRINLDT